MKILKTKKYSILSKILKFSFMGALVIVLVFPTLFINNSVRNIEAVNGNTTGPGTTTGDDGPGTTTGDDDTTGTTLNTKINNPLGDNIDDIPSFIEAIVNIVLIVGIPIVALAIIYTGFLFVTAQGSPEKITKAKKALVYTLIGAALLLGAFVIAQAIGKTVEDIKSTT